MVPSYDKRYANGLLQGLEPLRNSPSANVQSRRCAPEMAHFHDCGKYFKLLLVKNHRVPPQRQLALRHAETQTCASRPVSPTGRTCIHWELQSRGTGYCPPASPRWHDINR